MTTRTPAADPRAGDTTAPTPSTGLSRRGLLLAGGVLAASAGAAAPAAATPGSTAKAGTGFLHGIASGDPLPDRVVIWTRLTPTTAAQPGSGEGPSVSVTWEVSTDAGFRRVVARGSLAAAPKRDHTIKVDVKGLQPATQHWYRFRWNSVVSPVGRTRTAPARGAAVTRLRAGVVSCANWQAGYFSSYRHLAARGDLDVVIHLGDYVYEYGPGEYQARDVVVRPHDPAHEVLVLADYRRRHAQYKTDADLQALHASVPFVVTWDDHEFANDAWSGGAENHTEGVEGTWAARRDAAQRAYAEWMPVRFEPGGVMYRRLGWGSLASLSMLDLRSYRTQQVDGPLDPALADPAHTITGAAQEDFLLGSLSDTSVQWKLVGNPVMIAPVRFPRTLDSPVVAGIADMLGITAPVAAQGVPYNVDQWDGYPVERAAVLSHLRDHGIRDAVFLTGDIHSAWAAELPVDPSTYPLTGDSAGVELVCTSVTSDNLDDITGTPPRTSSLAVEAAFRTSNPHVKLLDFDSHGYSVLDVTPARAQMDWFVLSDRTDPRATSTRAVSFAVATGTQKLRRVDAGLR